MENQKGTVLTTETAIEELRKLTYADDNTESDERILELISFLSDYNPDAKKQNAKEFFEHFCRENDIHPTMEL